LPIYSPLTTGMHGIELRDQERRTIRLSAPLLTFSPSAGSMPSGSPLAASRSGPGRAWPNSAMQELSNRTVITPRKLRPDFISSSKYFGLQNLVFLSSA